MKRSFVFCCMVLLAALSVFAQQPDQEGTVERIIYVPYKNLEKFMEKNRSVYLPYQDYQKLIRELDELRKRPPKLPAQVLVSDANYRAKVNGDFLEVSASYTLDILEKGWHALKLNFGGKLAMREATLGEKPALLHWKQSAYELVLQSEQPGKQKLDVSFVVGIDRAPDSKNSVTFRVPRAPIARLNLSVPLSDAQDPSAIGVIPSLLTQRKTSGQAAEVNALLGNTAKIDITWESRAERKVEIKDVIHAENITHLKIGENSFQVKSDIRYDIVQGEVEQLEIKIPDGYRLSRIKTLKGAPVGPYRKDEKGVVAIKLMKNLVDKGDEEPELILRVEIEKTISTMEKAFSLPAVEVLGVETERGFCAIAGNDFYTLKEVPGKKNIFQIDLSDMPAYARTAQAQFAYQYFKRPFSFQLQLEKIELEYKVIANVYGNLEKAVYKLYANFQYDIEKSQIFRTRIRIPEGFSLLDVRALDMSQRRRHYPNQIHKKEVQEHGALLFSLDAKYSKDFDAGKIGREVKKAFAEKDCLLSEKTVVKVKKQGQKWLMTDADKSYLVTKEAEKLQVYQGGRYLLAVFKKGIHSNKLVVRIAMQKKLDAKQEKRKIALPVFCVQGAKRETGNIGLQVDPAFRITTEDKGQKGIAPLDIQELFATGDYPPLKNKARVNLGFQYILSSASDIIAAKFDMEKRNPEITATVYDYLTVEEGVLKHDFQVLYKVKFAGARKFSFSLPEKIAGEVSEDHVTDTRHLIQVEKQAAKDGRVVYEIKTTQDIKNNETYEVKVSYSKKIPAAKAPQSFSTFELITLNTKREDGFVAIFKKESTVFLKVAAVEKLETVDPRDPNYHGKKQDVFKIFKYTQRGHRLELVLEKLEFEPVLNTVINRLHISTSINKNYTTNNVATVLLLNNEGKWLDFELPKTLQGTPTVKWLSSVRPSMSRKYRSQDLLNYLRPLDLGKVDKKDLDGNKKKIWRVNITTHIPKNAPAIIVIDYNTRLKDGEMGYSGNFDLDPVTFPNVPVTNFTWSLGMPREYNYVKLDSELTRDDFKSGRRRTYGIWRVIDPLCSGKAIDTTEIKYTAETGVVPIYDVKGKIFSFSRLRGGGKISVSFCTPSWLYLLKFLAFLVVCAIIALVPKFTKISRLTLVLTLALFGLFLSSLDLQGYQDISLYALVAAMLSGGVALVTGVVAALNKPAKTKKAHTLVRDHGVPRQEEKSKESSGEKKVGDGDGKSRQENDHA